MTTKINKNKNNNNNNIIIFDEQDGYIERDKQVPSVPKVFCQFFRHFLKSFPYQDAIMKTNQHYQDFMKKQGKRPYLSGSSERYDIHKQRAYYSIAISFSVKNQNKIQELIDYFTNHEHELEAFIVQIINDSKYQQLLETNEKRQSFIDQNVIVVARTPSNSDHYHLELKYESHEHLPVYSIIHRIQPFSIWQHLQKQHHLEENMIWFQCIDMKYGRSKEYLHSKLASFFSHFSLVV